MKLFIILTHELNENRMNIHHVCTDPIEGFMLVFNVFDIKNELMSRMC